MTDPSSATNTRARDTAMTDPRPCSGCGGPCNRPGQRYCRTCAAEAARKYRRRHREEFERLRKAAAIVPVFNVKRDVDRGGGT